MGQEVRCHGCGTVLDESPDVPPDERPPCPDCGSKVRDIVVQVSGVAETASSASARLTVTGPGATPTVRQQVRTVVWSEPSESGGSWTGQVFDEDGRLLGMGEGDPEDGFLELHESILPDESDPDA